jgi:hypothetical protein
MTARKSRSSRAAPRTRKRARAAPPTPRFIGRDASPVLDRYPPKDPSLAPRGPPPRDPPRAPAPSPSPSLPSSTGPPGVGPLPPPSHPLITLDRPFDIDDFSALLGETSIRVTVPRESLLEVLQRVNEFMGFGIYVYAVTVRPSPAELLKSFVVELQRVDYSAEKGIWVPFVEKGMASPSNGPGSPVP